MSGQSNERESRRARKRRKERERQLQASAATTTASSQLGIRDVFSPADSGEMIRPDLPGDEEPVSQQDEPAVEDEAVDCDSADLDFADAPESASEQLAALQHALQEKDELLNALTEQLEEAANRLDRLHRAGADRGPRMPVSGSDELSAGTDISEHVSRLCQDWDTVQPGEQFEIIRNRLDDIFEAVTLARLQERSERAVEPAEEPAPARAPRATDSASKLPGWEAMKAQLLREGAEQGRSHDHLEKPAASSVSDSAADVLSELTLEPPTPIDLESADRDALAAAVEERDVFISHLIRRLRSGSSGRYAPINWAEVSGAPDDLRERLQEHEARLQELLRMEECDLSLERARLARERARLEQLRRDVERDARGGDDYSDHDGDRNERRWLRVFGFGRKHDGSAQDE